MNASSINNINSNDNISNNSTEIESQLNNLIDSNAKLYNFKMWVYLIIGLLYILCAGYFIVYNKWVKPKYF